MKVVHSSALTPEQIQDAFVKSGGEKLRKKRDWAGVQGGKPRESKKRKGLAESPEHKVAEAFVQGIKWDRIYQELERKGSVECCECGRSFTTLEGALAGLDAEHIIEKSKGKRYRPGHPHMDHPRNIQLMCKRCHRYGTKHSQPQFSQKEQPDGETATAST